LKSLFAVSSPTNLGTNSFSSGRSHTFALLAIKAKTFLTQAANLPPCPNDAFENGFLAIFLDPHLIYLMGHLL
jgi:hypothetical protein